MKKILYTIGFFAAGLLSANAQSLSTYAGTGVAGMGTTGDSLRGAKLERPYGLAMDANNNLYITQEQDQSQQTGHLIVMFTDIDNGGKYYSRAGSPVAQGFKDGTGANALLSSPRGITVAPNGTVYFVDAGNHAIRSLSPFVSVTTPQTVTTLAGGGTGAAGQVGYREGLGTIARFDNPYGIALDPTTGNLIVADFGNNVVRSINPTTGQTSLLAGVPGSEPESSDGNGNPTGTGGAKFAGPIDVFVDDNGDVYVLQYYANTIRKLSKSTGKVTTETNLNQGSIFTFGAPSSFIKHNADWFASVGCVSVRVKPGNVNSVVAGTKDDDCGFLDNNTAKQAKLNEPRGMVALDANNIIIADRDNNRLRKLCLNCNVTDTGTVTIAEKTSSVPTFSVHPNPASDYVVIESSELSRGNTTLAVFDMTGREVMREAINTSSPSYTLQLNKLNKGMYILKLQSGTNISTSRLMIAK